MARAYAPGVRVVVALLLGVAGAAWFLSVSVRRTRGTITKRRENAELALLALALLVTYVAFGR